MNVPTTATLAAQMLLVPIPPVLLLVLAIPVIKATEPPVAILTNAPTLASTLAMTLTGRNQKFE